MPRPAYEPTGVVADPVAEDVVRPPLVEQDERHEDQRDDAHHRERVVRRGGIAHGQAVPEVRARDHHPRVEAREQRGDGGDDPEPVIENARPFRPRRRRQRCEHERDERDAAGSAGGKRSLSFRSIGNGDRPDTKTAPRATAGSASRRAARSARSCSSPTVRNVRNVAPWKVNSSTAATPATSV